MIRHEADAPGPGPPDRLLRVPEMSTTELVLVQTVERLATPPGGNILLALLGLLLLPRARRLATIVLLVALGSLYALSTSVVASTLAGSLRAYPALAPGNDLRGTEAIVVLGADRRGRMLERLRLAASLHRRTGLPLLVTGGSLAPGTLTEAELMAQSLRNDFHVGVRFVEDRSLNTAENAAYSAALLAAAGVTRIVLVTHGVHMIRAVGAFEGQGLTVVPAPIGRRSVPTTFTAFLPSAGALAGSVAAIHEYLGRVWYRLRY